MWLVVVKNGSLQTLAFKQRAFGTQGRASFFSLPPSKSLKKNTSNVCLSVWRLILFSCCLLSSNQSIMCERIEQSQIKCATSTMKARSFDESLTPVAAMMHDANNLFLLCLAEQPLAIPGRSKFNSGAFQHLQTRKVEVVAKYMSILLPIADGAKHRIKIL